MKTLQNDFTTPEQSKRLLELGVPADSADFRQPKDNGLNRKEYVIFYNIFPFSKEIESTIFDGDNLLPCWSVGRLIKICLKCSTLEQRQVCFFCDGDDDEYSLIDYVVNVLESGVMTNHMDFSKLED